MTFCPICKADHDPSIMCSQKSAQALAGSGIRIKRKPNIKRLKEKVSQADRAMLKLLLSFIALVTFAVIIGYIISN